MHTGRKAPKTNDGVAENWPNIDTDPLLEWTCIPYSKGYPGTLEPDQLPGRVPALKIPENPSTT